MTVAAAPPLVVAACSTNAWDSALATLRLTGPLLACGAQLIPACEGALVFPERVSLADLVVVQRDFPRHTEAYQAVVERARAEHKRLVYELDDLLFELPEDHPDRHSRYYDEALLPMMQALVEADAVTTSTPALAAYCRAFNSRTWVLPNYLNDRLWTVPPRPSSASGQPAARPVVIGYMGGNSHRPDLLSIQAALHRIAVKYGDRIRFRFWGGMPPEEIVADVGDTRLDWLPLDLPNYAQFAAVFTRAQCDIFIAPLGDNLFNQCKSWIKFLEYSALGIPGVYSRGLPYQNVVEHGVNGFLAGHTDEWVDCLSWLIESPDMRRRLGLSAQTTVQRDWLLSRHAHEWGDLYRHIASPAFEPADKATASRVAQQALAWQRRNRTETGQDRQDAEVQEEIRRRGAAVGELSRRLALMQAAADEQADALARERAAAAEHRLQTVDLSRQIAAQAQQIAWQARQIAERDALIQGYQNGRVMRLMTGVQRRLNRLKGRASTALPAPSAPPPAGRDTPPPPAIPASQAELILYKHQLTRLYLSTLESFLASGRRLALPTAAQPVVTVVLILYNRAELTLQCLRSLGDGLSAPYEVLLIDNASSDRTAALLTQVDGARVIRNETNQGYLLACNQAAKAARGEYLLFLNTDAQVLPGAIDSALDTLRASDDIGAVGGKLILLDGSLQEAGSIVWSDGSCAGYGRGDSPQAAAYNFVRDVDYCSGAFLLTRRDLFLQMGGFDEAFRPAYYEECDYCLRLWQSGRRVVYDPGAVVLHYEFGSSESDDGRATTPLQIKHQHILARKHAGWLAGQHRPNPANLLWARTARSGSVRVLFIDDRVPHVDIGSGAPRAREMLLALLDLGCEVTLYPLNMAAEPWEQVYRDIPRSVEVMMDYGRPKLAAFLAERRGYYSAIVVSRPHNFAAVRELVAQHPDWLHQTRLIYDAEAIYAERDAAERKLHGQAVPAEELRDWVQQEVSLAYSADAVIGVSDAECAKFTENGYRQVYKLGHALNPAPTPNPFDARSGLLFVGGIHGDRTPNADAMSWFIRDILPRIRQTLGAGITLTIVGAVEPELAPAFTGEGVRLAGRVDDLAPVYNQARLFVAPTRYAAGIPLKVYDAAAHGLPVVATPLLASQLGWQAGVELLTGDEAVSFAEQCCRLYTDRDLWQHVRARALSRIETDCSPEQFRHTLRRIIEAR